MNCRLGFNKLLRSMHNDYKTCYGNVRYYHDYKEPTACSNVEPEKVHIRHGQHFSVHAKSDGTRPQVADYRGFANVRTFGVPK